MSLGAGGEESDLHKIYCAVWANIARSVVCVYDVLCLCDFLHRAMRIEIQNNCMPNTPSMCSVNKQLFERTGRLTSRHGAVAGVALWPGPSRTW